MIVFHHTLGLLMSIVILLKNVMMSDHLIEIALNDWNLGINCKAKAQIISFKRENSVSQFKG